MKRYNVKFNAPQEGHLDWGIVAEVLSGYTVVTQLPPLRIFTVLADDVSSLCANENVESVQEAVELKQDVVLSYPVPDDTYAQEQWALRRMNVFAAHEHQTGLASILVGIVDSGLYTAHEEFTGRGILGYDISTRTGWSAPSDSHGTNCASCVSPATGNTKGVCGVAPDATIFAVHTNDGDGFTDAEAAEGILLAQASGANIINFSAGSPGYSSTMYDAVTFVVGEGCLFVKSAGNNGEVGGALSYPLHPDSIIVASTDSSNKIAAHSSYGIEVDIAAPGESILVATTGTSSSYAYVDGTSFAAPHVAAVAALVWSEDSTLSAQEVKEIILSTVSEVEDPLLVSKFGKQIGCVDALKAVLKAKGARTGTKQQYVRYYGTGVVDEIAAGVHNVTAVDGAKADVGAFGGNEVAELTQYGQFVYRGPQQKVTTGILTEGEGALVFKP
jgi:subtilisin family serine protease